MFFNSIVAPVFFVGKYWTASAFLSGPKRSQSVTTFLTFYCWTIVQKCSTVFFFGPCVAIIRPNGSDGR